MVQITFAASWKCSCKPRSGKSFPIGTVQSGFIGRVAIGVIASGGSDGGDFLLGFR